MSVPEWVYEAVFYQIFPDRFANGDHRNDPPNVKPWGSVPDIYGFHGGDLQGIKDRLDYLLDLGVNAIYLNPIFQATSNHRYNTMDYYRIDPKLGDMSDFHALIEQAHRNNLRIILDGVFNHCGRGFFAFNDVLDNERYSPYRDWFHIRHFPLHAYGPGKAENYLAWWGFKELPKFNTDNPEVRKYLLDVARYWIAQGADGWRLDVPNEIDDDQFWAEFREIVKEANSEAYLVGEIWDVNPRWVSPGHFDGLMNYPLREAILQFLSEGGLKASGIAHRVDDIIHAYPPEHLHGHLNVVGSHDTERLGTICGEDDAQVRLAMLCQFCLPGSPMIYYGDEIGLLGKGDPDCRRDFPWDSKDWNQDLRSFVQKLIALRKQLPVLRYGSFESFYLNDDCSLYSFLRKHQGEEMIVLIHASEAKHSIALPVAQLGWHDGDRVLEALNGQSLPISAGQVSLDFHGYQGAILHLEPPD